MSKTGMGVRIREWRKAVPMKSYQLAKLIKVSPGSLSDIENEKSDPSASTIVNLLTNTDIDWVWFLTGKPGDIETGQIPSINQKSQITVHVSPGQELVIIGKEQ